MKRRALLLGAGSLTVGSAGCLSALRNGDQGAGSGGLDPDFDRCEDRIIPFTRLPDEVRTEVSTAFDEGVYETDGELWIVHAVGGSSVIEYEGDYYRWERERDGDRVRLRLEETTPTSVAGHDLVLVNDTDEPVVVSVAVYDDGAEEVYAESAVDVEPRDDLEYGERPELPITTEYGSFEIDVTVDSEPVDTVTWDIRRDTGDEARLVIEDDAVALETDHVALHTCIPEYTE